jgi:hypothetical protein
MRLPGKQQPFHHQKGTRIASDTPVAMERSTEQSAESARQEFQAKLGNIIEKSIQSLTERTVFRLL